MFATPILALVAHAVAGEMTVCSEGTVPIAAPVGDYFVDVANFQLHYKISVESEGTKLKRVEKVMDYTFDWGPAAHMQGKTIPLAGASPEALSQLTFTPKWIFADAYVGGQKVGNVSFSPNSSSRPRKKAGEPVQWVTAGSPGGFSGDLDTKFDDVLRNACASKFELRNVRLRESTSSYFSGIDALGK